MANLALDTVLLKKASRFLAVLDYDTRWEMLALMNSKGSMTVTELHTHFNLDQSHASYHLRKLRNAGFVLTARKWKYIYYSVNYENLEKTGTIIGNFLKGGDSDYLQDFESYIESSIPIFKPLPYKETYTGIQTWLGSFPQQLKDFTLAISQKKKEMVRRANKEGQMDVEALRRELEKSRKEGIKAFINQHKP